MKRDSPVTFVSRQRVFWDMLDLLGVLHNAAYLLLFERARTDFWRSLGIEGYGGEGLDWPFLVVRNEIDYRASVRSEQDVDVSVRVDRLGRSSITFGHAIRTVDGTTVADGKTVIVRIDAESQRPVPWSDRFRAMISSHIREQS